MTWLPVEQYIQTLPSATMYGALLFTDQAGNPLALQSAQGAEAWQFPGGNHEFGDASPYATAVRECREETGIVVDGPPELLLTHFLPPETAWPCAKVGFVFDGGVLSAGELRDITLDPAEHAEWSVRSLPQWQAVMSPRAFTRLVAVCEARRTGRAGFLCEPVRE